MYRILFLSNFDDRARNDNHIRLPRALVNAGLEVVRAEHDSLRLVGSKLMCEDIQCKLHSVIGFDLIWVLGFGDRHTFLDRMQLLEQIEQSRFVNAVNALVYRHGKAGLLSPELSEFQPITHVSNQPRLLYQKMTVECDWIVKPNAGSYGASVFAITKKDPNVHSILETLCGSGYVLLQERVDTSCEKRVLTVAGDIVGSYGKSSSSFRKNRAAGSEFVKSELSDEELQFASKIAAELLIKGINFAALDIAFPYILDVNFVNPGWLQTFEEVNGEDLTPNAISSLLDAVSSKNGLLLSQMHVSDRIRNA